jgi:hypothetical protein
MRTQNIAGFLTLSPLNCGAFYVIKEHFLEILTGVADPGSGAFLTPGSGMGKKSRSESGMNIPDNISESLETIFWVKNT